MKESEVAMEDIGAFVPFPRALLDEQMPRLKDTEWRLLCVIVRQTLGWQSGHGRKRRDWMSQKQLMKRTGRASAALSCALDVLVRENLVECHNSKGEVLLSAQQRRNQRGRIYYSLATRLLDHPQKPGRSGEGRSTVPDKFLSETAPRIFRGWAKAGAIAVERYAGRSDQETSP